MARRTLIQDEPNTDGEGSGPVAAIIEGQAFGKNRNPFDIENSDYEVDTSFHRWQPGDDVRGIHCTDDLVRALKDEETAKHTTIEAKIWCVKNGTAKLARVGPKGFLEAHKSNARRTRFKERIDSFGSDSGDGAGGNLGGLVGQDFVPLLGGPFTKQLYYTDYIKMHNACFFAFHHDPVARRIVNLIRHFTLGRGFRIDFDEPEDQALWDAFCEVNRYYEGFNAYGAEFSTYGECMDYWLPNNAATIRYDVPASKIPRAFIPRVRPLDPSTIWEIITYPEDLSPEGVIAYQQIFPTQYQMYTAKDQSGDRVPGTKFIYQQIPGSQVDHYKANNMSNEKRGRSDLFPVLSYLKRLRDSVNYALVSEMKNAAWSIDTTVDGSQPDIDKYVSAMRKLGTIPPAGSEHVHSKRITREYRGNAMSGSGKSMIFEWCLSMIAMGSGIPASYFGTLAGSAGVNKASAVVGTEPVTKLFEDRQNDFQRRIEGTWKRLAKWAGRPYRKPNVMFPDIITQDRSTKLKDLALAQSEGWIKPELAAELAAKELGLDDYDYKRDSGPPELNVAAPPSMSPMGGEPTDSNGLSGDSRSDVRDAL